MKSNMVKIGSLFIATLFSLNVFAGWSPYYNVERIMTYSQNDFINVYTVGGSVLEPGCVRGSWAVAASTEERRERLYAMLLTAHATKQKVRFWYTPGAGCAQFNYHKAVVVEMTSE